MILHFHINFSVLPTEAEGEVLSFFSVFYGIIQQVFQNPLHSSCIRQHRAGLLCHPNIRFKMFFLQQIIIIKEYFVANAGKIDSL